MATFNDGFLVRLCENYKTKAVLALGVSVQGLNCKPQNALAAAFLVAVGVQEGNLQLQSSNSVESKTIFVRF
jgi:hypothetical protein